MSYNINIELNPIIETIGLLTAAYDYEETKTSIITSLDELGFDGDGFYNNAMKLYEHYVSVFTKNCNINNEYDFYFNSKDNNFLILLIVLIMANIDELQNVDSIDDNTINSEIISLCNEMFGCRENIDDSINIKKIISFLDKTTFTTSERWKLLILMQSPKKHLKKVISMVEENIPAYEKAKKSIEKVLGKEIIRYKKTVDNNKTISGISETLSNTSEIFPTLAFPIAVLLFEKVCYCGLFSSMIIEKSNSTENLLQYLKAVSDKSRLEILHILKLGSKYNLEIAEQMGLSAATMSHHMSILLSCGLVSVSKNNGKVYYSLNKKAATDFVKEIESRLL